MNRPRSLLTAGLLALALTTPVLPATAATPSRAPVGAVAPARPAAKHKPHVSFLNTTYYAGLGNQVVAEGRVPGGKRAVQLQVRVKGGWRTFGRSKSNGRGKFAVGAPLEWDGSHTIRLFAPGRNAFSRSTKVSALLAYVPRGSAADYKFLKYHGVHYRFNPCQTIHYRVGYDEVGPAGLTIVQQAMAQISLATGIKTKYVGTTDVIPFQTSRTKVPRGTDLVVRYASEAEVPSFVTRSKAGFGGPLSAYYGRDAHGGKIWDTKASGIVLNTSQYYNGFAYGFISNQKPTWGEVVIHELGHAFGLAHVTQNPDEIMNGRTYLPYPDGYWRGVYAAGDLNGLSKLGLGQGCISRVRTWNGRTAARTTGVAPVQMPSAYLD